MKIKSLIWLDDIIAKLEQKHLVQEDEVEQVFANQPWFRFAEKGHRPGEHAYAAFGQTDAGRYLIVFFVYKTDRRALVISARDMTQTERKTYERR